MQTFFVSLSSISDVKKFVDAATRCACEVDVLSGRYVINAKSIMGLFGLDLNAPIVMRTEGEGEELAAFLKEVGKYIVETQD